MIWFLFFGDMLVMLFMAALAAWAIWRSPDAAIERSARIPLDDEADAAAETARGTEENRP